MTMVKASKTYYERNREKILQKLRKRYSEDAAFRERIRQKARERYHTDEHYRRATIERAKRRYREQKKRTSSSQSITVGKRNPS